MTRETPVLRSHELGSLYFAQLHAEHQSFFDKIHGEHNRIQLRDLPHYRFWRDGEFSKPGKSLYYKYLQDSWRYYFPSTNTHEKRMDKIDSYNKLFTQIQKSGVIKPIQVVVAPDGARLIIDGNHRASIAYYLGIDVPVVFVKLMDYLQEVVSNSNEFYGTKNAGKPYQSIFYKDEELVAGRRRDIYKRFQKIDIVNDVRGKTIADIGCNIAMSSMLAWHFGAKKVTSMEFSPKIASSALRLSTVLDAKVTLKVQDMGEKVKGNPKFDTVFCFSLDAHVKNKKGLEENIRKMTKKTLYLEGHEKRTEEDYQNILRHFKHVELIGYNEDGIHSKKSTRPFFKCTK